MKLPIRTKVAVIVSLIIVFLGLLASLFVFVVTREASLKERRETLLTLVTERAGALSKTMLIGEDVAQLVSEADRVKSFLADPNLAPDEVMNVYLEHFNLRDEFSAIYLMTATGSAVASTDRSFVGNNYSFRNYFKDAISLGVGREVAIGVTSKQQGFYFSFPVKDEAGKILGVAIAKMRNAPFDKIIKQYESTKLGESILVDDDGVILFSSKPEWVFRTLSQIGPDRLAVLKVERKYGDNLLVPLSYEKVFEAMKAYQEPTALFIYDRLDKRGEMVTLAKIDESKYYLILESGVSELVRQPIMLSLAIAGFVLLTALVTNVLVVVFLERSLKPIGELMNMVRRVGGGDFNTGAAPKTGDEVEELGNVFNQTVIKLRNTYSDLSNFKRAVENASSHIIITDPEAKIIYANPAASMITGYPTNEIIGKTPRLWGGQMGKEFYQQMWHQIKFERKPFKAEIKNRRKNGEFYTATMTISPILDEKNNLFGFVGLEDDISDRKLAEEKLVDESRKLMAEKQKGDTILASIGEGVVVIDGDGKIVLANPEAVRMFGFEVGQMVGRNYKEMWEVKDGLGNIVASRPVDEALIGGKTVSTGEYFYTRKDKSVFPVFITISPIIQNGRIVGVVDVFRDVSAEKAIDRAKSEFVSLASHQLRTPLSAVNWYVEMLLNGDVGPLDTNQKKYLEEVYGANRRMVDLVNSLLNTSRIDLGTYSIEPENLQLIDLVKTTVRELRPQITFKKLNFSEDYDQSLPIISADPKLVRIVVQNVLANAVKYTPEGGKVGLEMRLVKKGEMVDTHKIETDSILIKTTDTGYGIPDRQKDKVFQKLFRADNAKEKETEGTGLGLYIVKAVLDSIRGKVWFNSVENFGSTFYMTIPLRGMPRKVGEKQLTASVPNTLFY